MGDKVSAKQAMILPACPACRFRRRACLTIPGIVRIARKIGYPVSSRQPRRRRTRHARRAYRSAVLNAVTMTKTEAGAAFGNPEVYMEKYLENPRHVESRCWPTNSRMQCG